MSRVFDFRVDARIEWKTKLYHRHELVASPTFSVLGTEWYLLCSCHDEGFFGGCSYVAHLFPKGQKGGAKALVAPFEVATYVRAGDDDDGAPRAVVRRRVAKRESVRLWDKELSRDDIFDDLNCIRDLGEVWLVCLFRGAEPDGTKTVSANPWPVQIAEKKVQATPETPRGFESLSWLLQQENFPEVKLECGAFRTISRNGTLESETGTVRIPDAKVMEKLLRFIYLGKPGEEDSTYQAAERYAVLPLKEACTDWIKRNLTVENCIDYLVVADSQSDRELKAEVVTFICKNPGVLKSRAWIELSKELSKLACEVFQAYVASTVQ